MSWKQYRVNIKAIIYTWQYDNFLVSEMPVFSDSLINIQTNQQLANQNTNKTTNKQNKELDNKETTNQITDEISNPITN